MRRLTSELAADTARYEVGYDPCNHSAILAKPKRPAPASKSVAPRPARARGARRGPQAPGAPQARCGFWVCALRRCARPRGARKSGDSRLILPRRLFATSVNSLHGACRAGVVWRLSGVRPDTLRGRPESLWGSSRGRFRGSSRLSVFGWAKTASKRRSRCAQLSYAHKLQELFFRAPVVWRLPDLFRSGSTLRLLLS